ncbi:MAG: YdeI/OmpD-associated family protein [Bryobacterales bacterium]|nr:YdeI/OmpD-associated family protein [Bryobacterales bacterium]
MIDNIDEFFLNGCGRCERFATPDCSARRWAACLAELRRLCLQAGLQETVKWGHPCYMHAGRNIAILGAFRDDCRLTFFNAALMADPQKVLEKQGPNSAHPDHFRFTGQAQVTAQASVIEAYLREAMGYAEAGVKPAKVRGAIELPDELLEMMSQDLELHDAFRRLTPGRQRSYIINLAAAKTSATRLARIVRFRPNILAGKGALDR